LEDALNSPEHQIDYNSVERRESSLPSLLGQVVTFVQKRGYTPGERLPSERDLAERFAVSRGLIRETLATLEAMRYLERRPNSGVFLHRRPSEISLEALAMFSDLSIPLERSELDDCLNVQRILDVESIKLACNNRTDADIDSLTSQFDKMEAAAKAGRSIALLDEEFHRSIFRATQNNVLVRLVAPFFIITRPMRLDLFKDLSVSVASQIHHKEMVSCIASGDGQHGAELMIEHIERVESYWSRQSV
jgi:GntR family transcriptional repressor for pyruvate dehydrogenase complex